MKLSRDSLLTIGLFAFLAILSALAAIWQTRQQAVSPPLSTLSADPNGAQALREWLSETGYEATHDVPGRFAPHESSSLALILEPIQPINTIQWDILDEWVEDGGTLFIVGKEFSILPVFQHYEVDLDFRFDEAETLVVESTTPFLLEPPVQQLSNTRPEAYFSTNRTDIVTHLAIEPANDTSLTQPVLISFAQGAGRVYLSTLTYALSNEGLKQADNAAVIQNVVALVEPESTIWFDEWHHGVRPATVDEGDVIGPNQWLRRTPAGQALLYTLLVTFVALVLRGRYFGRPVPLPQDLTRRAPLEHITAIANLNRRAGHRKAVQDQYHQHLKRTLAKRYRLNPTLPDDEYIEQLAHFKPDLDKAQLLHLLQRLKASNVSENELLTLAQTTHDLTATEKT